MRKLKLLPLLALVLLLLPVGVAQAQTAATVNVSAHASLGDILTDGDTLYLFTNDERDKSNCSGGCAGAWPPLMTTGDPVPGEGVNEGRLGTITRDDDSTQVTFNGWPLYYYAADEAAGDANGQDRGGVWFVVSTAGGPIQTSAIVNLTDSAGFGSIVMDHTGRTQYLFTPDERDKSNCAGGCALAWPPLITVDAPTVGEGVNADLVGSILRDDGYTQVTYNGWPLYYFAFDVAPGDTNGQDSRDVWYVLSPSGGPIQTAVVVNLAEHAELGEILTDISGRTQYLFTVDVPDTSNCSGGCAERWPPLLTIDPPTPGEGVDEELLSTTTREDGTTQVTYNTWPLYYFAPDAAPGDARGQNVGGVWFVVTAAGQAVQPEPAAPATGDSAVPVAAQAATIAALVLLLAGGGLLSVRRRAQRSA